ncbi:MAG TPA: gamma-glutamylcyclotransferase [Allosphingosinicella sp.]|jgi:gamma-glutamylcyclotransferase (GGCT)/AIG2-like uncharacterized protein YtfP
MSKKLISVYGSLRKGLSNHRVIQDSEFLGTFQTEPIYSLHPLGNYPGLKENGSTSITMEVYAVDEKTADRVDGLEGYSDSRPATFYDKKPLETPFGMSSVYIYVNELPAHTAIESGDWKEFMEERVKHYSVSNN